MLTLIKNGEIYAPSYLGKKDVLITGTKVGYIMDKIDMPNDFVNINVIDAQGKLIVPGFIDSHVHICGGGGEGGYKTRTPEIQLSDITKGGVTTVVGVLGTDGTTRTMTNLIAKARGLEEEGITTYIHTGSYQIPVNTITGKIQDDIILIDKVIGVGEIALSDHRSSQPTIEDIAKVAAQARVGGILSGKAGIVNMHMGDGERMLDYILDIVENTEIPITQFIPTHMGRNIDLFNAGIKYAKKGGYLDFTTSTDKKASDSKDVSCSKAVRILLENGISIKNITYTSDGQGSLPQFDENGNFKGLGVGSVQSLYKTVRQGILEEGLSIEDSIQIITSNPANILKLENKGYIKEGKDADLVLLNKDSLTIDTVISMGKTMIESGEVKVKGTFE